jgi:hypothetical protein
MIANCNYNHKIYLYHKLKKLQAQSFFNNISFQIEEYQEKNTLDQLTIVVRVGGCNQNSDQMS